MKLTLDLVPSTSFYQNARSVLTKSEWKKIRDKVVESCENKCEICNTYYDNLDCHEVWEYKNKIQKLVKLIGLCKDCHQVKHFGLAEINGKRQDALYHLMKINKISKKQAEDYINKQFNIWKKRSLKNWILDISLLNDI